ncbi:MAG: hypothetical protein Q7V57_02445 [Actinomycetota bacterium]|nr:hypothetical protein [Actinomycetota bacterium]
MTESAHPVPPSSSRRQFLLAGSAALTGALLLGSDLVAAPSGLQRLADSPGARVPIAYVESSAGSSSLAQALAGGGGRAVPAAGLRGSSSLAGSGFRASVHGFAAAAHGERASAFRSVLVDALVPLSARQADPIPYYAFTFRRDPAVSVSGTTRVRVAAADGLRMGLLVNALADGVAAAPAAAVFTSGRERHLPTLCPGVYLLGLQQGMFARATELPALDEAAWATLPSVVLVVEADLA